MKILKYKIGKINTWLLVLGSGTFFSLIILLCAFSDTHTENDTLNIIRQQVVSPRISENTTFCGEKVPLQFFDVLESLERELLVNTYYHSQTLLLLKKSARYFPVIEPILKENHLPDDFKYLAVIESGLSDVVSPSGAVGFWQFMEGTAKEYGLEISSEVDERYHLEKSTQAACNFLLGSYQKYNNWTLVAASYNVGRNGVDRQIRRQGENNFYDLLFNEETARYIYRILAIKLVMENPAKYGFILSKNDLYEPFAFSEVIISESIHDMGTFAKQHSTNYKMLKMLNPWLRDSCLTISRNKEYKIKMPGPGSRVL